METQDRHLIALPRGQRRIYLSWRLLAQDRPDTGFYVEQRSAGSWRRLNAAANRTSTNTLVEAPDEGVHQYRIVTDEGSVSDPVSVDAGADPSKAVVDVALDPDDKKGHLVVGELTNDGRLGYVLRTGRGGTVWFLAFRHDGQPLWAFDTKLPQAGGWDGSMLHVPCLCWDINGDGRTEFVCHAATARYAEDRYDTAGDNEVLLALDGETGDRVWQAPWPARRSRVHMTVGHLRGQDRPASVVVQDGTYGDLVLTAVDGVTGQVQWQVEQERAGSHNLDIGDIDGDGVQEVIAGGICYGGDGTIRWETGEFGHTDISKPCKIIPYREGLQIWYAVEKPREHCGVYLVDKDGQLLFFERYRHAHYGWIARHAPGVPGLHPHTAEDARRSDDVREEGHFPIFLPDGSHWLNLTDWQRKVFVPVHWDEGPEVVFAIRKGDKRIVRLLETGGVEDLPGGRLPEGAVIGRNLVCVDAVGDYRENIVTVDVERHRLLVLANPTVARQRGYSPWDDFAYRHDRSQTGSGYYIYLSPPDTRVRPR